MKCHLIPDRLKTLKGKWPYRKKKVLLCGLGEPITRPKYDHPIIQIFSREVELLCQIPNGSLLPYPLILRRKDWPLKARASQNISIKLILAISSTKRGYIKYITI